MEILVRQVSSTCADVLVPSFDQLLAPVRRRTPLTDAQSAAADVLNLRVASVTCEIDELLARVLSGEG